VPRSVTGKYPPMHTKAPSPWHGGPTLCNSHKERATALRLCALPYSPQPTVKKANRRTRNAQPPCGYTPFHLCRNQRSKRRTAAQGACNCPTVAPLLSFAAIGGSTSGMGGPGPHVIHSAPVPGYRKVVPPLAPIPRLLETIGED
jgi:hypothetical protein